MQKEVIEEINQDSYSALRVILFLVLVSLGLITVLLVLICIYNIILGSGDLPILKRLTTLDSSINLSGNSVNLPKSFSTYAVYGILTFLLSIAAMIGTSLLKSACSLIAPDVKHLVKNLLLEIKKKS